MKRIFVVVLLLLAAGCVQITGPLTGTIIETAREGNVITYDHPFTDRADADVEQRAEQTCARKKKVAIKTSRACSLERCTTSYQCVNRADAKRDGLK
jgi:hypothetical protein